MPQGASKGTPALGELEALRCRVQVRTSARCGARGIRYDDPLTVPGAAHDQPQQLTPGSSLPATDAGPHRHVARALGRVVGESHRQAV